MEKEIKKKINKNLITSFLEHLIGVLSLFFIYRLIIKNIGIEMLGLWSLVLALFSLTSIGSAGFASSATKFVAKYSSLNKQESVIKVVETIIITVFLISLLFFFILYILVNIFGTSLFNFTELEIVFEILPLVMASIFLGLISGVYLSTLTGLLLIHLRSYIGIFSKVTYMIFSLFLVPVYGIKGLAISYFIHMVINFLLSFFYVKKRLGSVNLILPRFNKKYFKEIFYYGFNFQISAIFKMLIEPVTKFLLKDFSGLVQVGYFEVVYKFYFQARQLIVVLVNTFVPIVASFNELAFEKIKKLYKEIFNVSWITTLIIFSGLFVFLPLVLTLVNVKINTQMHYYSIFIFVGYGFNLLSVPAHVFNLGIGKIKINTIALAILAISNCIISYFLGNLYGGKGVILGWAISQILASIVLLGLFFRMEKINSIKYISRKDLYLISLFMLGLCTVFIFRIKNNFSLWVDFIISSSIMVLFTIVPLYRNKNIKNLLIKLKIK